MGHSPRVAELLERVRHLENKLAGLGALDDAESLDPYGLAGLNLTRQQETLFAALRAAHPKLLSKTALEAVLPPLDHARDRSPNHVSVVICKIKRKHPGSIENVWGRGFRISDAWLASQPHRGGDHGELLVA